MTELKTADSFTEFVVEVEPRLKHALVAAFGTEVGMEATDDILATYDASEHSWTVLQHSSDPAGEGFRWWGGTLTYDSVYERILVQEGDGVFAFAVGTGEWITLLEPIPSPPDPPSGEEGWPVIGGVLTLIGVVLALALYLLLAASGKPLRDLLRRTDQ